MKYKISQHLLILYGLTETSDLMWLRLNIAIRYIKSAWQYIITPSFMVSCGTIT